MPAKKSKKTDSKPKKPSQRKRSGGEEANFGHKITVRMYRVGFGDCFLLSLPAASKTHYVLIDCGVHSKGNIKEDGASLLSKSVQNIAEVTNKHLDIVIATHPHQDHISGFGSFAEEFAKFAHIGEVWMPWTEDPGNSTAKRLRDKRNAMVSRLEAHFAVSAGATESAPAAAVANMAGNEPAFKALHSGFGLDGTKIRYFKAGDSISAPAGIDGLKVAILGPPTDKDFLLKMDPPADDHYLRLDGGDENDPDKVKPFDAAKWSFGGADPDSGWPTLPDDYKEQLRENVSSSAAELAFALDECVNNCSIVALFSYKGKNLLFPGDAQYGNWKAWLESDEASLLSKVDFYKVSHHGSVNATPKEALEKMPDAKFAAMMSTQEKPWPSIPAPGLLTALDRKTGKHWVRSDSIAIAGAPSAPKGTVVPSVFRKGDFWFDYEIN